MFKNSDYQKYIAFMNEVYKRKCKEIVYFNSHEYKLINEPIDC